MWIWSWTAIPRRISRMWQITGRWIAEHKAKGTESNPSFLLVLYKDIRLILSAFFHRLSWHAYSASLFSSSGRKEDMNRLIRNVQKYGKVYVRLSRPEEKNIHIPFLRQLEDWVSPMNWLQKPTCKPGKRQETAVTHIRICLHCIASKKLLRLWVKSTQNHFPGD